MHILLEKKKTNCHLITYKYALNNLFELAFHCTGGHSLAENRVNGEKSAGFSFAVCV